MSGDQLIPLNINKNIEINFRPILDYYRSIKSLRPIIQRARTQQFEASINEGDIVLVLFNFYTGSTDFYGSSPFGDIPGGLLVATLIDSSLEGNWISSVNGYSIFIILQSFVGILIGLSTGVLDSG